MIEEQFQSPTASVQGGGICEIPISESEIAVEAVRVFATCCHYQILYSFSYAIRKDNSDFLAAGGVGMWG